MGTENNSSPTDGDLSSSTATLVAIPTRLVQGQQHSTGTGAASQPRRPRPPPSHAFGVAIICALPIEATAVAALFEERWDDTALRKAPGDDNAYSVGTMGPHRVVLAHMPGMGKVNSAAVASSLRSSFPGLKLVLLVGICGGAPKASGKMSDELLLGDVVVSTGVFQYDFGRKFEDGFDPKDTPRERLSKLSIEASALLAKLQAEPSRQEFSDSVSRHLSDLHQRLGPGFAYPGRSNDRLFKPNYLHKHRNPADCLECATKANACRDASEETCDDLGCGQQEPESVLESRLRPEQLFQPVVHFGLFASGDTVMKSGRDRDEIAGRHGVIAFEMEGAGLWERLREFSPLIIKSVCDYADSHKNKRFQPYTAAVAAATAKALLESWRAHDPNSLRSNRPALSAQDIKLLGTLKKVPYAARKDRNPMRTPGTCEWFAGHKLFRDWLAGSDGRPLWVSADPGCGKSVLARYLVDDILPSTETRTTCYFFFKDDFEDQKSAANAISCILHQLFTQSPWLFTDGVRAQITARGEELLASFSDLWELLLEVTAGEGAGEIICILDALDECGFEDRAEISRSLLEQHRKKKSPNLKFLLTSRPFGSIRHSFRLPDAAELAVVHLSGESQAEMEQISKEITIFIRARVSSISARFYLNEEKQKQLLHGLLSVSHRTYLWVYLTLNLIENDDSISKGKIEKAVSQLPQSVDEAYERVLTRSCDVEEAKRALHIIVAAETPLTLHEMNFALALRSSHRSYQDVDLASDEWFRERLRDICGLFVTVIESKIYLLHQTAKEFLVKADATEEDKSPKPAADKEIVKLRWKHSLEPHESHRVLGEICLWHLQFPELHSGSTSGDFSRLHARIKDYDFLVYSAYYWDSHLRVPEVKFDQPIKAMLKVIQACHDSRPFWFRVVAKCYFKDLPTVFPTVADDPTTTPLMIASFFGLTPAVESFIKTRGGVLARDSRGKTALVWAATYGHDAAAKALIDSQSGVLGSLSWLWRPTIVDASDNDGLTPLIWAARRPFESTAKLLLDKGANLEARDKAGRSPLLWACNGPGGANMVRLLLKERADVEAMDHRGATPLTRASEVGDAEMVKLLLQFHANIDGPDGSEGKTPLVWAIEGKKEATIELLLENKADIHMKSEKGFTALTMACEMGQVALVKDLLKRGADVESRTAFGYSALATACINGHEAIVQVLLEQHADIESRCQYGCTPLSLTWQYGGADKPEAASIAALLLRAGADIEGKDARGTSVLASVAAFGNPHGVRWLLKNGADIESRDEEGRTPLAWAAASLLGTRGVEALLEKRANVNSVGRDGKSPLHMAIIGEGRFEVIKQLLESGANIEQRDNHGRTALSYAAGSTKDFRLVKLLLESYAEVNSMDARGRTPLFWATSNTALGNVALDLIKVGADVNVKDEDGRTPLALACEETGSPEVAKLLRDTGARME